MQETRNSRRNTMGIPSRGCAYLMQWIEGGMQTLERRHRVSGVSLHGKSNADAERPVSRDAPGKHEAWIGKYHYAASREARWPYHQEAVDRAVTAVATNVGGHSAGG